MQRQMTGRSDPASVDRLDWPQGFAQGLDGRMVAIQRICFTRPHSALVVTVEGEQDKARRVKGCVSVIDGEAGLALREED